MILYTTSGIENKRFAKFRVRVVVFNATFNNIAVTSWLSVLLVGETGVPGKTTDLPQVTSKLYHTMVYPSTSRLSGIRTALFIWNRKKKHFGVNVHCSQHHFFTL